MNSSTFTIARTHTKDAARRYFNSCDKKHTAQQSTISLVSLPAPGKHLEKTSIRWKEQIMQLFQHLTSIQLQITERGRLLSNFCVYQPPNETFLTNLRPATAHETFVIRAQKRMPVYGSSRDYALDWGRSSIHELKLRHVPWIGSRVSKFRWKLNRTAINASVGFWDVRH